MTLHLLRPDHGDGISKPAPRIDSDRLRSLADDLERAWVELEGAGDRFGLRDTSAEQNRVYDAERALVTYVREGR